MTAANKPGSHDPKGEDQPPASDGELIQDRRAPGRTDMRGIGPERIATSVAADSPAGEQARDRGVGMLAPIPNPAILAP
ncbi:MAG TPA: hypothetical protein VMM13_16930 [Euzebya sp.]|nr:hypothetical protein [Euzebya sp.]